ncbi:Polyhydroxyalkanoate synthesis regulator phasin [Candidatus Electrothrix laxa]
MKELLKNMIYTGVGAAFLTRDKLDEIRKDLVGRGNLTREEGKEFVEDLLKKSDNARDQLELWLNRQVEKRIKELNLATVDEVEDLRRKVEELETALQTALNSKEAPLTSSKKSDDA